MRGLDRHQDIMNLKISLEYFTVPGEIVSLVPEGTAPVPMQYVHGGRWEACIKVPSRNSTIRYSFILQKEGRTIRKEWGSHQIPLPSGRKPAALDVLDYWQDRPSTAPFWTKAFTDVIFRREASAGKYTGNLALVVPASCIMKGECLAVTGSGPVFNDWKSCLRLSSSEAPLWEIFLDAREPFEYKYVVIDELTGELKNWEAGSNRHAARIPGDGTLGVIHDPEPVFGGGPASMDRKPWRGAGVAIPVFSLRSEESFGVGEFRDLKKLVDWASATGQSIIQLLPINDTTMTRTWTDSYPYNANSTFALHPQFISLRDAGVKATKEYKALQKELNSLPQIDYERVNNEKDRLLREAFKTKGKKDLEGRAFQSFFNANCTWLEPYAAFCVLRDENGTPEFGKWKKMKEYSPAALESFKKKHLEEMEFYFWEQFCLDVQLKDAVAYAHSKGVAIKGDLPIGISRTSVDAWQYPSLFNLDSQAGAPPDAFSADGQNWGFPTYNWEEMSKDGYGWWKARLGKMSEYFDAFRIDHILGFFRIWEIPYGIKSGLLGHFNPALPYSHEEIASLGFDPQSELFVPDPHRPGWYHPRISSQDTSAFKALEPWKQDAYNDLYNDFFYRRHNSFWKDTAMKKLPALLDSTKMMACGEDLGMIPACVPEVMDELKILSLEVQRMPKSPQKTFDEPWTYPYLSVCTTGSHDTSSLRAWWEEDREMTSRYYHDILHFEGEAPSNCEPWICERILMDHLASPSMLCIMPLQDWLSVDGALRYQGDPADERINVPANPRHYWRWRMHITLEELLGNTALSAHLKEMVSSSGRG